MALRRTGFVLLTLLTATAPALAHDLAAPPRPHGSARQALQIRAQDLYLRTVRLRAEIEGLQRILAGEPAKIRQEFERPNPTYEALQSRKQELRAEHARLLTTFKPNTPEVIAAVQRLEDHERRLAATSPSRNRVVYEPNPTYLEVKRTFRLKVQELAGVEAEYAAALQLLTPPTRKAAVRKSRSR
ncbi:MAG: hypothetical protein FJX77_00955 [Armatimonadetes bacterium]|nr:hypothetical protein [Armatimonadota bacterium]